MIGFLVRRILFLIPVLLGGSAIVFSLIQMAPGDPIDVLLGVYASPEARAALREQLEATCRVCSSHGCIDCTCQEDERV